MSASPLMTLRVLLPFRVLLEKSAVLRIVAEAPDGSFGLLPRRLDCIAVLGPGVLIYETGAEGEAYVAVDEGVLVKIGLEVLVSVRWALAGADLGQLRATAEEEFKMIDEHEGAARSVIARLEAGFVQRFASLQDE